MSEQGQNTAEVYVHIKSEPDCDIKALPSPPTLKELLRELEKDKYAIDPSTAKYAKKRLPAGGYAWMQITGEDIPLLASDNEYHVQFQRTKRSTPEPETAPGKHQKRVGFATSPFKKEPAAKRPKLDVAEAQSPYRASQVADSSVWDLIEPETMRLDHQYSPDCTQLFSLFEQKEKLYDEDKKSISVHARAIAAAAEGRRPDNWISAFEKDADDTSLLCELLYTAPVVRNLDRAVFPEDAGALLHQVPSTVKDNGSKTQCPDIEGFWFDSTHEIGVPLLVGDGKLVVDKGKLTADELAFRQSAKYAADVILKHMKKGTQKVTPIALLSFTPRYFHLGFVYPGHSLNYHVTICDARGNRAGSVQALIDVLQAAFPMLHNWADAKHPQLYEDPLWKNCLPVDDTARLSWRHINTHRGFATTMIESDTDIYKLVQLPTVVENIDALQPGATKVTDYVYSYKKIVTTNSAKVTVGMFRHHLVQQLQAAHKLGIIHGDVHPGNILVTESSVVLIDWSLAGTERHKYPTNYNHATISCRAGGQRAGLAMNTSHDWDALKKLLQNFGVDKEHPFLVALGSLSADEHVAISWPEDNQTVVHWGELDDDGYLVENTDSDPHNPSLSTSQPLLGTQ
eukprot:TRINITY_DN67886_c1_g7_i1.p1 TRINITY_DN67886_c1_g7~~TRINITY_DN67886_c1_g7_i1.p1  ORF type:complete len:626 (+),score=67.32 TRINITY_DN67886_c1_g7_i1:47-1924(+)